VAPYRIYAYGGFYEHGSHPHEIESCVFQINSGNSTSAIKIWKFSAFRQKCGFDATMDKDMGNGVAFIGIKNFSPSNKATLYDELIGGACNIKLSNKLTEEIAVYKSNGVFHIQNTDLIKINFIKGE
jgi:hypothetical protein